MLNLSADIDEGLAKLRVELEAALEEPLVTESADVVATAGSSN